ncbi:MAG: PHP domain-containing protein [Clostridia bacterium]
MKEKFIDLHVHTKYSDGFDSIDEVIAKAKENNVGVISLTEHYNLSSYKIACELAGDDIEVIPGIEIGADMSKYSKDKKHVCHILGYFISKDICKLLDIYELDRYECVVKTIKFLNSHGVDIELEDVIENARDKKSIGRFDIALTLKKLKYTKTASEAYGKYLDHCYVQRKKLTPVQLVRKIREYGGVAVLAHPKSLRFTEDFEEKFIEELVDAGLGGIEVYNPNNGELKREQLLQYCEKYDLVPTVGSDYHGGKRKPVIEIGKGIGNNLEISDLSIISRLKDRIP